MIVSRDRVTLEYTTGGITLTDGKNKTINLHPLWIRERITSEDVFDP